MKKHKITAKEIRNTYQCSLEDLVRCECGLCHNRQWLRMKAVKNLLKRGDNALCTSCGTHNMMPMKLEDKPC